MSAWHVADIADFPNGTYSFNTTVGFVVALSGPANFADSSIFNHFTEAGAFFRADSGHNYSSAAIGPSTTLVPAALPFFATGLSALGLLGWRRKKKTAARVRDRKSN
jgi:hypothetical protein